MKTNVIVKFQIEGMHFWPDAAKVEPTVAFLAHPHRHIFHFTAEKNVSHSDRDIEIIKLKRAIIFQIQTKYHSSGLQMCDFGSNSCEMLAEEVLNDFDLESCECLEDNENGAKVYKS